MAIDTDLLLALVWDKEFDPYPKRIFVDKQEPETVFFCVKDDDALEDSGIPPEENAATRKQILENPDRYVEVPVPSHA